MIYALSGDFVECCDCFTVCPCWVSDVPDEDHCSGLYLWSLGEGSHVNHLDVSGMHVAAATFHAVRAGGQAIFFIDAGMPGSPAEQALADAFAGRLGGAGFVALHKLFGTILGHQSAQITSTFDDKHFNVEVKVDGRSIASAEGTPKTFGGQVAPMTLRDAALADELGIGGEAVTVQAMKDLIVDVAALPGGPLHFRGRSGMRSTFSYLHHSTPMEAMPDAGEEPAGEETAGDGENER